MSGAAAEELKEKRALLLPADILVAATGSPSVEPSSVVAVGQVSVSSDGGMSAPSPSFASADEHTACSEGPTKKRPRTQAAQTANAKEKHPMLCPCSASCRRKCTQKVSESRRSDIYTQYWQNPYDTRRTWMNSHIVRVQVQRRRPVPDGGSKSRQQSYLYKMPTFDGSDVFVCKTFFLHTLGYNSDKVVTCLMQACDPDQLSPQPSKRGRHKPPNCVDESVIVDHINSYNPQLSHYRREHAPRRRYLPPEITLKSMFADFMTKQPKFCTYDKYRKVVKK